MTRSSWVLIAALASLSCDSEGFPVVRGNGPSLTVTLNPPPGIKIEQVTGSRLQPLALAVNTDQTFNITVRAIGTDGTVDASFNGYVRISSKPGAIERIESPDADGRSLKLVNGQSPPTDVRLANAYGTTFIIADDLGYAPVDPLRKDPPACANGKDDDGDSRIDFPSDEGCAFANDDSEAGGSYAAGQSQPIYYALPRIADVRGLTCSADGKCNGAGKTPYPKEAIQIDTGFHNRPNGSTGFDYDMVVTRISSDGFYLSDINDERGGFNNVFAFNFSSPPSMRVCDRIKAFAGTASEFFGFTQISYPTWSLEEWDPQKRPCLVPEPDVLGVVSLTPDNLLPLTGGMVRVQTIQDLYDVHVSQKLGEKDIPIVKDATGKDVFAPQADATNCDLNKDGNIDFTAGSPEAACSAACDADVECTEFSNFDSRSGFKLTVHNIKTNRSAKIQADATTSAAFHPLELKGAPIRAFTGTLHYFSGGNQFTIEARCADDIVTDMAAQPLPSDKACVTARTVLDENPQ